MCSPHFTHIICAVCQATIAADAMSAACPVCGSQWLDARYDYQAVATIWRSGLSGRLSSLWRYAELLPIVGPDADISLQEGNTPLLRLNHYERLFDHPHIFVKDERQGATSSFKDRQAALTVTAYKQAGITECVLASTGNAGAAYAAYCARAGIKLWLFLTSLVPAEKMREAALYGAEVVKVSGTYDEAKQVAAEFARHKGIYLDRGARGIPGKESMKTLAFEMAEQLGLALDPGSGRWVAPDWYIQAVSGGIGPLGVWKGFQELYQMGFIDKLPRLAIIQAAGCAPMVQAFAAGQSQAEPVIPRTLIHVLATGDPGYAYVQLREAVLTNQGTMLAIEDGDTFAAMRKLASTAGLSVEPATAVAFAGLEKLLYDGTIDANEVVAINCSGHTFPAESHVLGDQYLLSLELQTMGDSERESGGDGLLAALQSLDEQVTTVLVVDDNPNDRRLIRRLLQAHKHYRVFEARSGKEALRMIDEHLPDLIVADLTMPEMDGLTLIEQLKWNPTTENIPIVVVSAKTLTEYDREVLNRYTASVWTKGDFETQKLVQHIVGQLGDEVVEPEPRQSSRRERQVTRSLSASYRALVIDDDPSACRLLRRWLEKTGSYSVKEAQSGRDGLRIIYEHQPDVVMLDLRLPDMHGLDVLDAIRKDDHLRQTAVIAYTGKELSEDDLRRLQGLNARVLEKTRFNRDELVLTIDEALSLVRY